MNDLIPSETVKAEASEFVENAIGVFMKDPLAAKNTVEQLLRLPSTIRDGIYWENFLQYLLHVYEYDEATGRFSENLGQKLAEMLAEETPNEDAGYPGDRDRLRENAKRLVKLIDDAGTMQKAVYYANLTRAVLHKLISRDKFFKLCNCVRSLTEEDLLFLTSDIQKTGTNTIKDDRDNLDDFRAVGLLMEVEEGFSYTRRAFELLKYGLKYEESIVIPENIQSRMKAGTISNGEIDNIFHAEGHALRIGKD